MKNFIYGANIVYTLAYAGAMIMYCITLGSYFSYLVRSNRLEGFTEYYGVFRNTSNVKRNFFIFMIGQFLLALISFIFNRDMAWLPQILAILGLPIIGLGHKLTGFLVSEDRINSARDLDPKLAKNYLDYNIPLHLVYSLVYLLAGIFLLGGIL